MTSRRGYAISSAKRLAFFLAVIFGIVKVLNKFAAGNDIKQLTPAANPQYRHIAA